MLIDGKTIAAEILEEVRQSVVVLGRSPRMSAIACAPNFETRKYLEMKRKRAEAIGITIEISE